MRDIIDLFVKEEVEFWGHKPPISGLSVHWSDFWMFTKFVLISFIKPDVRKALNNISGYVNKDHCDESSLPRLDLPIHTFITSILKAFDLIDMKAQSCCQLYADLN